MWATTAGVPTTQTQPPTLPTHRFSVYGWVEKVNPLRPRDSIVRNWRQSIPAIGPYPIQIATSPVQDGKPEQFKLLLDGLLPALPGTRPHRRPIARTAYGERS
jgi:hypothetical protein